MQRFRSYFRWLALLSLFLLGTWISNTAVAMPLGVACVGMPMADMPCCPDNPGMGMRSHCGMMHHQCMAICAESHAPGGLGFPEISFPEPVWIGVAIRFNPQYVAKAQPGLYLLPPTDHPPPLLSVRLTI